VDAGEGAGQTVGGAHNGLEDDSGDDVGRLMAVLVPMPFNTAIGAEVQRPLATVVISAMVMSLLVLRVLYVVFAGGGGLRVEG